jgi:hypothetical protein
MTRLLAEPPSVTEANEAAARLRHETAALRLSFTWFGVRKTLSADQKAEAAQSFGAAGEFLSAGKKLFDTRHPRVKAVAAVRRQATAYFQSMSLPFPEPAVRLIRRGDIDVIQQQLEEFAAELTQTVADLEVAYDDLRSAARRQLGRLYSEADYPSSLAGLFAMGWDFPSVEPPEYLRRLSPELYQEECRRAAARFDEAVELAEQMFLAELGELVSHLAERLSGAADGKPKVFRDSAVEKFEEFFARFGRLSIHNRSELDELVERARETLAGVAPQQLRDSGALRQRLSRELTRIEAGLDGLLEARPRRNILRHGS